jgi:chromosome condensin MukBEF ATPase and DNA-binding subunit MukB
MAKYHRMVEWFKEDIEYIKKLKAEYETLKAEIRKLDNGDPANYERLADLYNDGAELDDEIRHAIYVLEDLVNREYELVPFAKPRNAGITGFWRESGLR